MALPEYLSHSRVSTYMSCGEKYRLSYVVEHPRAPQGAFIGGIAVHDTIEDSENLGLWGDPDAWQEPDGAGVIAFRTKLLAAVEEAGGPEAVRWGGRKSKTFPNGEDLAWWFQFGPGMLNRYHTIRLKDAEEGWGVLGSEVEVGFNLDSGMRVVARMDQTLGHLDHGVKVRDWKTGQPRPEERIQLALYAHACKVTLGLEPAIGELQYLKQAKAEPVRFATDPWVPVVHTWLERAEEGLRSGVYLLRPSSFCVSCNVQDGCVYWQRLQAEGGDDGAAEGSNDG